MFLLLDGFVIFILVFFQIQSATTDLQVF